MILRLIPSVRANTCPLRTILTLRARPTPTCCAQSRLAGVKLPQQQFVRRASSLPKTEPKRAQPKPKYGYIEAGQPLWQIIGLTAASTVPFLTVWYLTSPMAVWIHLRTPNHLRTDRRLAARYLLALPADAELAITTMGALGRPRVTHVRVWDLWPAGAPAPPPAPSAGGGFPWETAAASPGEMGMRITGRTTTGGRRWGLVNYVRDGASVARENARRRGTRWWWTVFFRRAVTGFRIEDETTTGRREAKYDWEGVARQIRQRARLEGL
ncbi:hypothetical protein VMCG_08442 [Cytospora schulzeri]|uniref:Uncharacterized protein n=1 Tax=Cytospora schulzeri TaxID=448051 RepID=A0A423VQN9_9PEZI|nr:hypothetical protein VMCG_08442 [Valsa malicola]